MASEPMDLDALIERLQRDEDARRRLLAALLPQEFLALPLRVEQLTAVTAEHGERITRLERVVERLVDVVDTLRQTVQELATGQQRVWQAIAELRQVVQQLADEQQKIWQAIAELTERIKQLEQTMKSLLEWQIVLEGVLKPMRDRFADLVGWRLQSRYAETPYAYFGRCMKRIRRVDLSEIEDDVRRLLDVREVNDFFRVDVVLKGKPLAKPEQEVYVVLEVSAEIDSDDVVRASRRAALLRRVGYPAVAAVGGQNIDDIVRDKARNLRVVVALDGSTEGWEEALAAL